MRRSGALILLIVACSSCAGFALADEVQTDVHTSTRNFEIVAACAYSALAKAHPGKITFADAKVDLSVGMVLRDTVPGPLGGSLYRELAVTIVGNREGSTIDIVSPEFDPEATWSEIKKCAP